MSSEHTKLKGKLRNVTGKKVRALRREGQIPAVIYGKRDPVMIQLDFQSTSLILRDAAENNVLDLTVDGTLYKVLLRDTQKHVLRGDLMHIDFLEVDMNELIRTEAPIYLVGESSLTGGSVGLLLHTVEIEATPDNLVSEIELDSALIVDEDTVIHVRDLTVPEGVTIVTDGDLAVAKFNALQEMPTEDEGLDGEDGEGVDITSILESAEE
ncbi:MAG: 50S ribosomal protein L25 [Anaerolineales bacterium]|nr:50S ribosomal protein L25 [Anaerolineales bacterium]